MYRFALLSLAFAIELTFVVCRANDAWACYVEYVLKEHDTLQSIAHQIYNDPAKWHGRSSIGPIRIAWPSIEP